MGARSPDVCDDLSADPALARLVAGHHPARGGHDGRAHAAEDTGNVILRNVAPAARAGDPLHAADHRAAVFGVAQSDPDHVADPAGLDAEVRDVALLLEDAGHLPLQPGGGDLHLLVRRQESVADPVQIVGDWIGEHAYQLDLVIPGT